MLQIVGNYIINEGGIGKESVFRQVIENYLEGLDNLEMQAKLPRGFGSLFFSFPSANNLSCALA